VEVRTFLRNRFVRIFVDEFQDADRLQAEILLLLAGGDQGENDWRAIKPIPANSSLWVIRSSPSTDFAEQTWMFIRMYETNLAGARIVYLAKSFRATQPIQGCVNAAFADEMLENRITAQASYVPLLGGALPI
jgi:ATP-dependent helicase/nuclease subunit A